jgi:hypothetical protein
MPDTPVEPKNNDPYHPDLQVRVSRLEDDVHDVKATMGQLVLLVTEMKATLDATLPHLATKAELADMRTEMKADMGQFRQEMTAGMARFRQEVTADMAQLRQDVTAEVSDHRLETAAEFAAVRQATSDLRVVMTSEFAAFRAELAEKPSKTYMWGVLTALLTAYACGLAALAILK